MAKIRDVAREAGVSIASVSRVLTGARRVSDDTKAAVLTAAEKLGYRTNYLASALRRQATRTLGMVIPRIANPYFIALVQTIEESAQAQGYELLLCDSADDADIEKRRMRALLSRQVEGIILIPCDEKGSAETVREALREVPVVSLDRSIRGIAMDQVCVDNRAGIVAIIDHLAGKAHRRLAFVGAQQTVSTARERLEAYREYVREWDLPSADRVLLGEFTVEWGEQAADRILADGLPPDAVVCGNDLIAAGVIRTLRARGLDVPGDIAVTGFDDIELCRFIEPAITTVHQPLRDIGTEGARRLFARIEGTSGPAARVRIRPSLVVRASSG
ncbi:LacI family DNA-binding transcriptional regulator [Shumkonia mesophila]|uniref:LacI family DNA-binding transcriptional regulator n=1 Tax=Shumkonia mesophila TaxID=2838854 RepID=UPI0029351BF2|nr:LacI family DNA-binding transcriptional regulator [Shumkonia mesophila]